jgi:ABC-2 type transport system ATP-binding protein
MIRQMAKDKCIVISTHILEEVEAVCTRAIVIARGRLLADGTPAELSERGGGRLDVFFRSITGGSGQPAANEEQREE